MKEFNKWMHKHFSMYTPEGLQVVDDFAGSVGFVVQEHAGAMTIAICCLIFGLVVLKVFFG